MNRQPRLQPWIRARWLTGTLLGVVAASWMIGLLSGCDLVYLLSQTVLAGAVYASLVLLADRPLLNASQAPIFLFYWLFGLAPIASSAFELAIGSVQKAAKIQNDSSAVLFLVAAGLPLYGVAARTALATMKSWDFSVSFLEPSRRNYAFHTVAICLAVGLGASYFLRQLADSGESAVIESNYLGGVMLDAWWLGPLSVLPILVGLANSSLMTEMLAPRQMRDTRLFILGIVMLLITLGTAITGGWKGAFMLLFLFLASAYTTRYQRPPIVAILIGSLLFALVIEPFVSYGRRQAELHGVTSSAERQELFTGAVGDVEEFVPSKLEEVRVESFFRGIVPIAGEILRQSDAFEGAWEIDTIGWGMLTLLPRFLFPDKPALNIGNYIAGTIGFSIGQIAPDDEITNVSPSIIFEVVGNYGWVAGIIVFPVIGFLWTAFWSLVLSIARFETHPLSPFAIAFSLHLEAPFGHFMTPLKNFATLLVLLLAVSLAYRLVPSSPAVSRSGSRN
jgi:hypothetical protein